MGKASAPKAPDPIAVSNAQSAANIASAEAQQKLNMVGTSGPTGMVGWTADPNQPGGYTQTTTLSQPEQQSYDLSKLAQNAALGLAGTQIGRVSDALGQSLDLNSLPALNTGSGITAGGPAAGDYIRSFDQGQAVQGQINAPNFDQAIQQAQNAVYGQATSRLDPQFDQRESQLQARLANQGLGQNSEAYQRAVADFGRERTDAYNQANFSAIGAGNQLQNQLFGQEAMRGQFANEAAGQMYGQNLGSAQFANQGTQQNFADQLASQQLSLQQQVAQAQMENAARQQALQEQAYAQNMPLNQFNSLMSSGQVGLPEGIGYTPSSVGQTDVMGAYALNQQAQQNAYNAKMGMQSGIMGGLAGLGQAAILASDINLKTDIRKIGTRPDGLGVYRFRYKDGGAEQVGVMAQEVLRVKPEAVYTLKNGYLAVDYGAI